VTAPAPKFMLAGNEYEYLYHNSTLALDGDTGEIVWHFQHVVDHWDLDHPFERLLLETEPSNRIRTPCHGSSPRVRQRRASAKSSPACPGKTGLVYTLDRETGEFLWARETIRAERHCRHQQGIGCRSTVNPETVFTAAGQERLICPSMSRRQELSGR
jgi:glucose dehydrogenase